MLRIHKSLLFAVSFAIVACSSNIDAPTGEAGATSSGATSSSTTSNVTSSSSSSSGGGEGCASDGECDGGLCVFTDGLCGKGAKGTCGYVFSDCGGGVPTCYCNGVYDATGCGPGQVGQGGVGSNEKSCFPTFQCGATKCQHGTQSCSLGTGPTGCTSLPQACFAAPSPTCACLGALGMGCTCMQSVDGDLTVTCN